MPTTSSIPSEPSVIDLLKRDHAMVRELFEKFEGQSSRATKAKHKIAEQILTELTIHADLEEQGLYPRLREEVKEADEEVLEALEEHHVVRRSIEEIRALEREDETYEAKMAVLKEMVMHHVKEEEKELLPRVQKALGAERMRELGRDLAAFKEELQKKEQKGRQTERRASA